jgi:hypothetical protein
VTRQSDCRVARSTYPGGLWTLLGVEFRVRWIVDTGAPPMLHRTQSGEGAEFIMTVGV